MSDQDETPMDLQPDEYRRIIQRLRALLGERSVKLVGDEIARLRAQLAEVIKERDYYAKMAGHAGVVIRERDEAQREVEQFKGMHQTVLSKYEELSDETEKLEREVERLTFALEDKQLCKEGFWYCRRAEVMQTRFDKARSDLIVERDDYARVSVEMKARCAQLEAVIIEDRGEVYLKAALAEGR